VTWEVGRWVLAFGLLLALSFAYLSLQSKVQADESVVVATVRVRADFLKLDLSAPEVVTVGERFRLVATLTNTGPTQIRKAQATIQLPLAGLRLNGQSEKNVGTIRPGQDKKAKWNLVAEAPGNFVIMVKAVGTEEPSGDLQEAETTALIEVVAGPGLPHPEGTALPSGEEHGEGGVIDSALSGLRSMRDFFATLISS
jgi:hypothetical protein